MKRIVCLAAVAAALFGYGYHEYTNGNNIDLTSFGQYAADAGSSREMTAVGMEAGYDATESYQSIFIGRSAGAHSRSTMKGVGIGYNALGDATHIRNVVGIGNYELAGISGVTNTTSINNGQIFVSETYDVAMLRTQSTTAPTNSPFCYMQGNTYIGGTGTTYIAGNVVFGGRTVVVDNSYVGGGGSTAKLAGSGDLADQTVPYSSGDCQIFVSSQGRDDAAGTFTSPYLTIDKALKAAIMHPANHVNIGVMAGEYAYPSNALLKGVSTRVSLIGLEGSAKTKISAVASGLNYDEVKAATINVYQDRAVLQGSDSGSWMKVVGFTFDGRSIATKSYSDGSYSCAHFYACRFTGKDFSKGRKYNRMTCANCIFENCIFDDEYEVNMNDSGGSDQYPYWWANPFFACAFYNSVVINIRKVHNDIDTSSQTSSLFNDCEFWNSMVLDTRNKWNVVLLNEVTSYGIEDSAICVTNATRTGIWIPTYRAPYCARSIIAVESKYDMSHLPPYRDGWEDSYCCHANDLWNLVDDNLYPLDNAVDLFGMGYNNSLTRRFVEWNKMKQYTTRDYVTAAIRARDTKAPQASVILAENGDLNIYSVTNGGDYPPLERKKLAATQNGIPEYDDRGNFPIHRRKGADMYVVKFAVQGDDTED